MQRLPNDGELILQADHLITRANSATYADTGSSSLCKGVHGWKKWREREYNALLKEHILPADRVVWERCERDSWKPVRTGVYDWKIAIVALKKS